MREIILINVFFIAQKLGGSSSIWVAERQWPGSGLGFGVWVAEKGGGSGWGKP